MMATHRTGQLLLFIKLKFAHNICCCLLMALLHNVHWIMEKRPSALYCACIARSAYSQNLVVKYEPKPRFYSKDKNFIWPQNSKS